MSRPSRLGQSSPLVICLALIAAAQRTYRKAPQNPPTSVFIKGVNPSTFKIVWRYVTPSIMEEPISGYKIRVWPMDQDMSTAVDTIIPVGSELEAYVTNLTPGKKYNVRVLAYSNGGDGRMSSPTKHIQMGRAESFISTKSGSESAYYESSALNLMDNANGQDISTNVSIVSLITSTMFILIYHLFSFSY